MTERMLRADAVKEALGGISTTTLYRWMAEGHFPRPKRVGQQLVMWPESQVNDWLASRPVAA